VSQAAVFCENRYSRDLRVVFVGNKTERSRTTWEDNLHNGTRTLAIVLNSQVTGFDV
jgi:hypothetical protein